MLLSQHQMRVKKDILKNQIPPLEKGGKGGFEFFTAPSSWALSFRGLRMTPAASDEILTRESTVQFRMTD
jgi:hypothetical protein